MAITYHSGRRIQATQADFDGTPAVSGGWKEVGRTTLGSEGDAITVSSLPDKRYYQVLVSPLDGTGNSSATLRLGYSSVDSGNNYSYRFCRDGGSDSTATSQPLIAGQVAPNAGNSFDNYIIANKSNKEKLVIGHGTNNEGSGAGTAPRRTEIVGKWANTSNLLDTISIHNDDSGNFGSGSEVVVLGYDPDDTHTDNFWEQLADVSWSSGSSIDTGVFTSKKYLWIQGYHITGTMSGAYSGLQVGNSTIDTGSNYAERYSFNDGTDGTQTSASNVFGAVGIGSDANNRLSYYNMFIINNASTEKLGIAHAVNQDTAGAGTAPNRQEDVFKWTNTSNQIDRIQVSRLAGTGDYTGGQLKVWGSN